VLDTERSRVRKALRAWSASSFSSPAAIEGRGGFEGVGIECVFFVVQNMGEKTANLKTKEYPL
jgi:hypothetical protein